jgi:hypothetical protein
MQIDLDALERLVKRALAVRHTNVGIEAAELSALIAKVRELERLSASAYQNGMADERKASNLYAKGWNDARRAMDVQRSSVRGYQPAGGKLPPPPRPAQRDTARGVPEGWKLVPVEPTPEIMAGAALAVLRPASKADLELAQATARIVLERATAVPPGLTADMLAASIATMAPAYRAMLASASTPPAGDAELDRDAQRYAYVLDCEVIAARKYLPNLDAEEFKTKRRAAHDVAIAASKGEKA